MDRAALRLRRTGIRSWSRQNPGCLKVAKRRAAVTLEVILTLPAMLLIIASMIELSTMVNSQQHLQLAVYAAAMEASRTELPSEGEVPDHVVKAARTVLTPQGIKVTGLRIDHNVADDGSRRVLAYGDDTLHAVDSSEAAAGPTHRRYVRATVLVPSGDMAPNLLALFGFDLSGRTSSLTMTVPHLLNNKQNSMGKQ